MHPALLKLLTYAWQCSLGALVYAAFAYFAIRHRPRYLRSLDLWESWLMRLGIPKRVACFGRSYSEGRGFWITCVVLAVGFLLLALWCVGAFFYYRQWLR